MKRELRQILPEIIVTMPVFVRRGEILAENNPIAPDEQLHAEQSPATERLGNPAGDLLGLRTNGRIHRLRLPRLAVVSVLLIMADRLEERSPAAMTYREKRDFIVEIDEPFDDHASGSRPTSFLRILPGPVDLFGRTDDALPVSRRAHYRLHDARRPDLPTASTNSS